MKLQFLQQFVWRHSYWRAVGLGGVILFYWYIATYVLMMDWRISTWDPPGKSRDYVRTMDWRATINRTPRTSRYRFAEFYIYCPTGGFTTLEFDPCWANDLFFPIDMLVRALMDNPRPDSRASVLDLIELQSIAMQLMNVVQEATVGSSTQDHVVDEERHRHHQ